jgi:hypothetical protein
MLVEFLRVRQKASSSWVLGYMLLHISSFPFLTMKIFLFPCCDFGFAIEINIVFVNSDF